MSTLAYFYIGADGQETMPRFEVIGEADDAVQWYADMVLMESVPAQERPGFAELLKFARKGDVLVVTSLDRLGTSSTELLTVFQVLEAKGVTVMSIR